MNAPPFAQQAAAQHRQRGLGREDRCSASREAVGRRRAQAHATEGCGAGEASERPFSVIAAAATA